MSVSLDLRGVSLEYPVYSVRAQSLRSAVMNVAVGGRLMRTRGDHTVVRALSDIHLRVGEGDRLALVGHNGSGKTTLLKVIAGIIEPTRGLMRVEGRITSMISLGSGMDWEQSGEQNIRNIATMRLMPKREIEARLPRIVEFSELGAYIHLPVKTYSAGMIARLTFSVATELDADILVLDEWLGAGDAEFRGKAAARMNAFVERARLVVLATHDHDLVAKVCNKVCELEAGQVRFFGTLDEWIGRKAADDGQQTAA